MHTLPPAMILLLRPFAPLFFKRVWMHVQRLLMGAILAPAQRTVTAALRVIGLGGSPHFPRYHRVLRVLSRAGALWQDGLPSLPAGCCGVCSSCAVADSGYAAIRLLARCSVLPVPITVVTHVRLDAALYEPAPPRQPWTNRATPAEGERLPTLAAPATDPATDWQPITVAEGGGIRSMRVRHRDTSVDSHGCKSLSVHQTDATPPSF